MIANAVAVAAAFGAVAHAQYAMVVQPQYNSSYVMPSLTNSASSSYYSSVYASASASATANVTGGPSAVIPPPDNTPSFSVSAGFPSYSNTSTPSITMGPKIVTDVVTRTITSCPVVQTHGTGSAQQVVTSYTDSTVTETRTVTVCTKCVEVPKQTSGPGSSPGSSPGENNPAQPGGGEGSPEQKKVKITKTVYSTLPGGSTVIKTVTSTRTKTLTNTHVSLRDLCLETRADYPQTATATAGSSPAEGSNGESSPGGSGPGSSPGSSPENGAKAEGGNQVVTATKKIYITKTTTVLAGQSTCPAQVTVTVHQPDVTVTVTASSSPEKTGSPGQPGSGSESHHGGHHYGNGTEHNSTKCRSTGFITKPWPSATGLLAVASAEANANHGR